MYPTLQKIFKRFLSSRKKTESNITFELRSKTYDMASHFGVQQSLDYLMCKLNLQSISSAVSPVSNNIFNCYTMLKLTGICELYDASNNSVKCARNNRLNTLIWTIIVY